MSSNSERQPLIVRHRDRRSNSLAESLISIKDYIKDKRPSTTTLKFIAAIIWALFAIFVFNLIFLPRTSLARDYRRIHFSTLSKDETERLFLKSLRDDNRAREYLHQYSNFSSQFNGKEAKLEYTIEKFKEFGFSPYTKKYYTYLNEPVDAGLSLLDEGGNVQFKATLRENVTDSNQSSVFHAYSASGNVTAQFIFANYGSNEDYQLLRENHVDTSDKIHIIRHGEVSKGIKVQNAELSGAVGVVFYSDPYDDGDVTTKNGYKAYPDGPARSPFSIERGTVLNYPGDPTTPDYACTRGCKRQDPSKYLPKIPSLPISQIDAEKILKSIGKKGAYFNWTGDLEGFDYSVGPSDAFLNLYSEQDFKIVPMTNVFYEIPGLSKEKIIIGSHRDSLSNNGAGDPNSGCAILLEITRGFSDLMKKGWNPQRTIVVASFDGEEYGALGSTEYAEANAKELQRNAIAYLNLDLGVVGPKLKVSSNPLLDSFLKSASELVPFKNDPEHSVSEFWKAQDGLEIDVLGERSDYSVFQHHLGIPSCMIHFGSDNESAIYHRHSDFDSIDWIERFVDHDYQYHNTLATLIGFLALSFSEHEVIEYKTSHYASVIDDHFNNYIGAIPQSWLNLKVKPNKQIIPLKEFIATVTSNLDKFIKISKKFDERAASLQDQISIDYPWFRALRKLLLAINIKVIDTRSKQLDRLFLFKEGLKDRAWMKHIILAPERENGLKGDVLPGLHEAIRDNDIDEFVKWLKIIDASIRSVNKHLKV